MCGIVRQLSRGLAGLLVGHLAAGSLAAQDAEGPSHSLQQVISVALDNNRDLQEAQLGLLSANEQVREAWGSLFPTIDANVGYQRNLAIQEVFLPAIIFDPNAPPDMLIPVRFGADNNWSAWLYVTQPIFDAAAFIGVGTADRFQDLQREVVRGQAQEVASRVRRTYYQALLAHEEVRVTEESVSRTEETLRETEGLYRVGLASSYDVLRLEVRLANLRPNLRRARNAALAAERDLSVEMGLDEVSPVRVAGRLHDMNLAAADANEGENRELLRLVGFRNALDASFESLYELAQRMRSDLRQAQLNYELQDARVKHERTSMYPRLEAFFNYGIIAQEDGPPNPFGENSNQRTTSAVLGVSLEIPVFSGFQRSARVQQRKLERNQARVQLELLEQQTANQIRTALDALGEARERAEAQAGAVDEARRGYEIVTAQYLAGVSSQLEVTEGEVLLRETEFNYAQAVYDYLIAQSDLDDAVGLVPLVDVPGSVEPVTTISE
ncbi:MAG: TolC family protein [Gemmatimonadota bacterium]|nr:MAG: TolC family protein [Gemmatimonadota bacterium]